MRLAPAASLALALLAAACAAPPASGFRFVPVADGRELWWQDTPLWREVTRFDPARPADTCKVFLHVYAPDGRGLLTKGPDGSYPHHRGVFVGWNRTRCQGRTWDFWHCGKGETQRWRAFVASSIQDGQARSESSIDWVAPDGTVIVRETRAITAHAPSAEGSTLDFTITLAAAAAAVELDGDAHHAGFHFRAAQAVAQAHSATYERSPGAKERPDDRWTDTRWVTGELRLHGRRYRVTVEADASTAQPVEWSTRDYGRFGAFCRARLEPEHPLTLRYTVRVAALGQ